MKEHKTKLITIFVVLIILAAAWFFDAASPVNHPTSEIATQSYARERTDELTQSESDAIRQTDELTQSEIDAIEKIESDETYYSTSPEIDETYEIDKPNEADTIYKDFATYEYQETISIDESANSNAIDPIIPSENTILDDGSFTVTLSVRVHTILYNMHLLHRDKHELIPENGWIFQPTVVTAYEGDSVFDVLQREMRRNGIHMVSRHTPMFDSAYIEAIGNIFEFDVGPLSGWMYRINGNAPTFGSSLYLLNDGDVIEWMYTVDLGRDLGIYWVEGAN